MYVSLPDPPVFKSPPKSVEADLREEINLECDVDGNPLEIVWVHAPAAEVSLRKKQIR